MSVADEDLDAYKLSAMGFFIAPSGQKTLEMLDKTPIDLVLMDIMMPGVKEACYE
jgi:CheY-like chemotaxis protein